MHSGLRDALLQVLDTLAYAERELLEAMPAFKHASVLVHLQSDVEVRADSCRLEPEPTVCLQHMLTPHGSDRVLALLSCPALLSKGYRPQVLCGQTLGYVMPR